MPSPFSFAVRRALRSSLISASLSGRPSRPRLSSRLLEEISNVPSKTSLFLLSGFATSAKQFDSTQRLRRVLEAEIIHAEESDDVQEGCSPPEGFPFEIVDNPGDSIVTLKRVFAGESIEIEACLPDLEEEGREGSNEDDSLQEKVQSRASFVVNISKGESPRLVFCCTGYEDDITIDELLIKYSEAPADKINYEGPKFLDLDEELQKAFYKYLDVRGINGSLVGFMQDYTMNKDGREYLTWLKSVKDFIEK